MSQTILSRRAKVPQSTISRLEQNKYDVTLSTLHKILKALSCDLVIAPLLHESVDTIKHKQDKMIAQKRIRYLKGTMSLELQQPDPKFLKELEKGEEEELLRGSAAKLWRE